MAARMSAQAVTLPKIWLRSMTIETYQQIDAEQVVANVQSGAVVGLIVPPAGEGRRLDAQAWPAGSSRHENRACRTECRMDHDTLLRPNAK